MTVLLTGFEPFAGDGTNPSGAAVRLVEATWDRPEQLIVDVLPVEFEAAATRLRTLIAEHQPSVVIAVGLAGGRAAIGVERVALNLIDARIADNSGAQPIDVASVEGAPVARFATLPVKAVAEAIREVGIAAEVSHSAGTFVCNHVFYSAMDATASDPRVRAGFIHVPWNTEDAPAGVASIPLADIARSVRRAIDITLDPDASEPRTSAGTVA